MKLTKKKALQIAIELWEWIVDNPGEYKFRWPGWEKYGRMRCDCPFCEYNEAHPAGKTDVCNCPLDRPPYNGCCSEPCAYNEWDFASCGRHAIAVEFLAQLRGLK